MVRSEVSVALHHRQGRVAEKLLQLGQGHAALDRPRRERVAQVVERRRRRELRLADRRVPRCSVRRPARAGEHPAGVLRAASRQDSVGTARERDLASLSGFGDLQQHDAASRVDHKPGVEPLPHVEGDVDDLAGAIQIAAGMAVVAFESSEQAPTRDLEAFVRNHCRHGPMTGDATEPAWNGYLLTVACPVWGGVCAVVTPEDADADLVRVARLN